MKNTAGFWLILSMLFVAAFMAATFPGCRTNPATGERELDLTEVAHHVSLIRQDLADLAPLATPETQAKLAQLDAAVLKIEEALRVAGTISDVSGAARAALDVADLLISDLRASGQYVGDWPIYLGAARIALRHLSVGEEPMLQSQSN